MSKFVESANAGIAIIDDACFTLNDNLFVNVIFTASSAITANSDILRVIIPDCGEHAEIGYFNTGSDDASTAAGKVKRVVSSVDGIVTITVQLDAATAANQEYCMTGWIKLP